MDSSSTDNGKQAAQEASNPQYLTTSLDGSNNGPQGNGGQQEAMAGSSSLVETRTLLPTPPREPSSSSSTSQGAGTKRKLDAMLASDEGPGHFEYGTLEFVHDIGSDEDAEHESVGDDGDVEMLYDQDAEHESVSDEGGPAHEGVPSPDTEHADSLYTEDAGRESLHDRDSEYEDESMGEEESEHGSVYEDAGDESMSDDE